MYSSGDGIGRVGSYPTVSCFDVGCHLSVFQTCPPKEERCSLTDFLYSIFL